jgi:hypothetical protein
MQRAGIGDDYPHVSDAEPVQGLSLAIEVGQRILLEQSMGLEEPVELRTGAEAEDLS